MEEKEIISLSRLVFNDEDFKNVNRLVNDKKFHLLRHFISNKLERASIDVKLGKEEVNILENLNRIEDICINLAVEATI